MHEVLFTSFRSHCVIFSSGLYYLYLFIHSIKDFSLTLEHFWLSMKWGMKCSVFSISYLFSQNYRQWYYKKCLEFTAAVAGERFFISRKVAIYSLLMFLHLFTFSYTSKVLPIMFPLQSFFLPLTFFVRTMFSWWRHQMETLSALLAICARNSPVPGTSPQKDQWRGALMFSLICAWINGVSGYLS